MLSFEKDDTINKNKAIAKKKSIEWCVAVFPVILSEGNKPVRSKELLMYT